MSKLFEKRLANYPEIIFIDQKVLLNLNKFEDNSTLSKKIFTLQNHSKIQIFEENLNIVHVKHSYVQEKEKLLAVNGKI